MSSPLDVQNISVAYGANTVIHNIQFGLEAGEIGCLLGPSGCGKTTLLRCIAGFQAPSQGTVRVDQQEISSAQHQVAPEKRNIGMVFQDFALFPHLSVEENIAFGLRLMPRKQRHQRVMELLALIGMPTLAQAFPHQLSGGQQQRVALARAMAPSPGILLLDEPFSSMDVELRVQLAREVRNILKQENSTAILVTHDQHEAFAMADSICVINQGRLEQHDSGYNLYHRPLTPFVADFIGEGVILPGMVVGSATVNTELGNIRGELPSGCKPGCKVDVLIRPDDVVHDEDSPETAVVVEKAFRGSEFLYTLRMPSGVEVLSLTPSHLDRSVHEKINIRLDVDHLVVFRHSSI